MLRSSCILALPAAFGLALGFVACSSATPRDAFDPNSAADASGGGADNPPAFNVDSGADAGSDGCSDQAKLVYVLSLEGDLYSFAPAAKKFTKVGPLNCKSGNTTLTPISMAVDRNAVAWVNMRDLESEDGEDWLFKVDTATAVCTPTAIKGSMGGMGFSTNPGTTDQETLFVVGDGSGLNNALSKVDFVSEKIVPIIDFEEQVDLELTGTGDGRLYGFLIGNPLALAAVDKSTTVLTNRVSLSKVQRPQTPMFAFSFWGGDFYFYTATSTSSTKSTNVSRYRPSDDSTDTSYMMGIGFHIVGAGVSTCAPTSSPK